MLAKERNKYNIKTPAHADRNTEIMRDVEYLNNATPRRWRRIIYVENSPIIVETIPKIATNLNSPMLDGKKDV